MHMGVWARINIQRGVWITGLVAVAHMAALSWVLSQRVGMPASPVQEFLEIDFAELPSPEPETPPLAEPAAVPEPDKQDAPEARPDPIPDRSIATAPSPKILTQLETKNAATVAPPRSEPVPAVDADQTVDPSVLAAVLQRVDCQRLSHKIDEKCPKLDPFDIAEATLARQTAAPAPNQLVGDYGPKSMLEGFFSQRDSDPFLIPGMDGDLFTPGMAPGAYDAQRIRNGQAPLWSQEMRDGFSKQD